MNKHFAFGLAATMILSACAAPSTAPAPEPVKPDVPDSTWVRQEAPVAPKVEEVAKEAQAPATETPVATPNVVQNGALVGANGSPISIDQLSGQIPTSIPQAQAAQYLQPLANLATGTAATACTTAGAYAGVAPGFAYGALSNALYYPYQGYYIPYTLYGDAYYPYFYNYANSYVYPLYYGYGGAYYPYYYYSDAFCGGCYGGFGDYGYYGYYGRGRNGHHDRDGSRGNNGSWHRGDSQHESGRSGRSRR